MQGVRIGWKVHSRQGSPGEPTRRLRRHREVHCPVRWYQWHDVRLSRQHNGVYRRKLLGWEADDPIGLQWVRELHGSDDQYLSKQSVW